MKIPPGAISVEFVLVKSGEAAELYGVGPDGRVVEPRPASFPKVVEACGQGYTLLRFRGVSFEEIDTKAPEAARGLIAVVDIVGPAPVELVGQIEAMTTGAVR